LAWAGGAGGAAAVVGRRAGGGVGLYSLAVGGVAEAVAALTSTTHPSGLVDWLERLGAARGHGLRARRVRVGGACSCCRGGTD
jgi:hypothetical protein